MPSVGSFKTSLGRVWLAQLFDHRQGDDSGLEFQLQ